MISQDFFFLFCFTAFSGLFISGSTDIPKRGHLSRRRKSHPKQSASKLETCQKTDVVCCIPGSPTSHLFLIGWFPNHIILVGVYHLPKGTTSFKMVVDFQGYMIFGEFFSLLSTPDVNECWCSIFEFWSSQNGTLPETNGSPLKMDGWNTTFLFGRPIFRGFCC